jgi:ribonuclease HII
MLKARHTADLKGEVGIDEAGRGCLWGPLVAGAVWWPEEGDWTAEIREVSTQIRDSKKLSAKRRGILEAAIKRFAVAWGLGVVTAAEIDQLGMTKANRLAFTRALEAATAVAPTAPGRLLIDGLLGLPASPLEQIVEPAADGTYLAVAAASILAKEGRDRMVAEACAGEPLLDERYGLLSSKGYGTAKHRAAVKEHGMVEGHRRLFLRKLLGLNHTIYGDVKEGYDFLEEE